MTANPGDPAPDFTLSDAHGRPVTLREVRSHKRVVLVFFPAAFTSVCTKEMCTFRDEVPRLGELAAVVLGISRDPVAKLARFASQYALEGITLLSDADGAVSRSYGALSFLGHSKRATFVVDRAGVIRWRKVQLPIFRPDPLEIRSVLEALEP